VKVKREINIKPSCMSEIHAFPADQTAQLWEKINYLVDDPHPDGHIKKKLRTRKHLYRLRVGDYRVFYTFGDAWVRLLGIRRRNEQTYDERSSGLEADTPAAAGADSADDELDELLSEPQRKPAFKFDASLSSNPLPRQITTEWLRELGVPSAHFPVLLSCNDEDSLLAANLPGPVLERVVDNLFPHAIEEVERQPDLVVQDTADLVRYREGSLIGFLLRLDDEQRRLTEWALQGPTMVKGGAGTGKSTVALYRVKAILERPGATGQEQVLFATYTRALIAASRQLLEQLLPPDQMRRVRVATCDEIAREIVASKRKIGLLEASGNTMEVLRAVRAQFRPTARTAFDRKVRERALAQLSDRYLLEEFDWIIDGRGLGSCEEYVAAPRPGRGFAMRPGIREAVWQLHEAFLAEVRRRRLERFTDLRREALDLVRVGNWSGHLDYVLVDEVQDLAPIALCLMAEVARAETGLFFAADSKQSIYSRNYSFTAVHPRLHFRGRTAMLQRNYRSTAEIDRAAFEVLAPEEAEELERSRSIHSGPMPVLIRGVPEDMEGEWAARFVRQMAKHLRLQISSAAVLVPNRDEGERLQEQLTRAGLSAKYFAGRELDLRSPTVKVLTLHSAKGLEFPIVVMGGFRPGSYPEAANFGDREVFDERMRNERRLLYVGMTRAMRGLLVIQCASCGHEALRGLGSANWHVEEAQ
jgi:superfamily I DNA/RNA helicase/mRNA-degrading endonuclease RelE of RelBE toxin-antitoxin system